MRRCACLIWDARVDPMPGCRTESADVVMTSSDLRRSAYVELEGMRVHTVGNVARLRPWTASHVGVALPTLCTASGPVGSPLVAQPVMAPPFKADPFSVRSVASTDPG